VRHAIGRLTLAVVAEKVARRVKLGWSCGKKRREVCSWIDGKRERWIEYRSVYVAAMEPNMFGTARCLDWTCTKASQLA